MDKLLDRLRDMCLEYPEVFERVSHGYPAFFVRNKRALAMYRPEQVPTALWCPCEALAIEYWLGTYPDKFYIPPYMGPLGWVGIHLGSYTDWGMVQRVVNDAYRRVAPKKLVNLHFNHNDR